MVIINVPGGNRPGLRRSARVIAVAAGPSYDDSQIDVRRDTKKGNLKQAKEGFPHKVDLKKLDCDRLSAQSWLHEHRCFSWKQKGANGDYFIKSWDAIWFADPKLAMQFKLANFKK